MALKPKKDPWVRSFTVTDPSLHRNGYTVYKVKMQAFCVHKPEETKEVCVWKRYSDFKKLHKVLSTLHRNLHRPGSFPQFAEPVVFGRFNSEVVDARRKSAQAMLDFVGSQTHLFNLPEFQNFLKTSEVVPHEECMDTMDDHGHLLNQYGVQQGDARCCQPPTTVVVQSPCIPLVMPAASEGAGGVARHDFIASTPLLPYRVCGSSPSNTPRLPAHGLELGNSKDDCATTYRASNELSYFDPLNEDRCSSVERDGLPNGDPVPVDLPVLDAEVDNCFGLPEVPAAELDLLDTLPAADPVAAARASLNHPNGTNGGHEALRGDLDALPQSAETRQGDDYLADAEGQALQGERYFALGKIEVALKHYECAVTLLVRGVQDDPCEQRRALAGDKTRQYLQHAECIAKGFLHKDGGNHVHGSSLSNGGLFASPSLRLGAVSFDTALPIPHVRSASDQPGIANRALLGAVGELSNYKVLGIIDKVMLVLDKLTESTYVMKVLQKNELYDDIGRGRRHVIPTDCPYMVRIHRYYETESTIYLLLQHANGGRLCTYVSSHLQSLSATPRQRTLSNHDGADNVYSGRKYSATSQIDSGEAASAVRDQGSKTCLDLLYDAGRLDLFGSHEHGSAATAAAGSSYADHNISTLGSDLSRAMSSDTGESTTSATMRDGDHPTRPAHHAAPALVRRWSVASDELDLPPPPIHRSVERHSNVPENFVKQRAAEILTAIMHLHSLGVVCRDLRPDNVLLASGSHVLLTFFGKWVGVRNVIHVDAIKGFYAAPELLRPVTPGTVISSACDWWSFGVLLYELLVGQSLRSTHPDGVSSHTRLSLPAHLSVEACDLLTQLIKCNPSERLGAGPAGQEDIMSHPFFRDINWLEMARGTAI